MTSTPFRLTVAEWEAELDRRRDRRLVSPSADGVERCRSLFRDISAAIRRHRHAGWISHAEYQVLRGLSDESLLLARLACLELARFEGFDVPTSSPELLEWMLIDVQTRLQAIDAQLELIQSTWSLAEMLRPVVQGVLATDGYPARRLEPLLNQLEARGQNESFLHLVPWPGLSLKELLARKGWPHAGFYASAIQGARWTAALRRRLPDGETFSNRFLIAAALLADIGLLVGAARGGNGVDDEARSSPAYRRHPDVSAALISGMAGASPEWAVLASQHHERVDGSGFPQRLCDRQLRPAARELAAALRWSELTMHASVACSPHEALSAAAQAIWRETERGAFDREVVGRMLAAFDADLGSALVRHAPLAPTGLLDPPHLLPGPHVFSPSGDENEERPSAAPPSQRYLRHARRHVRPLSRNRAASVSWSER
jgi:hypothetical protein